LWIVRPVEDDLQRIVGRNLRAHRQARGLSQEAFADILGVHRTYMGGIERGERNLTLRSLEKIARSIDMEPLLLLTANAVEDRTSPPLP
jgi:transcriptional regulator with XRE-family HTH domain